MTVFQLIEKAADKKGSRDAIIAPGRQALTYERMLELVTGTIEQLRAAGIGRNDRVAIVLPQGPELATTFLAVAAGATSAPLNPNYREQEFQFYLSDLRARATIVQSGIPSPARDAARKLAIPIFELTPNSGAGAGEFEISCSPNIGSTPEQSVDTEDVALVLHTSGTTSRPKLVPLTQSNICCSAQNIRQSLQLTQYDRCLNVMPLFHIHGLIGATLSSISAGASVACTPRFSAPQFFESMDECRPTWYTAVPTMHQAILECAATNREILDRSPLRLIRSSSSALPPLVMAKLEEVFNAPVIESYGMTEASHQMASNPLPPHERKPGSVGRPAGPEVAIMDEAGNFLVTGKVGEIVIRGANVTAGYENNPEANKGAFVGNWFRTGDQGYLDSDGYLFISGRLKEIVNRGAEKVSPREIDETLMKHPDILQGVAFAVPHPSLGEDIAAAVVLREKATLTEEMIREYLFERLADFKVPSQVLIVDQIPKGATGKVQRIGLAEKFTHQLKREFVAPESELEMLVASIYGEILDIDRISANDNFFVLGGDSLRATRMISAIRSAFQLDLPIATIFRKPSVAQLAEEIARCSKDVDQTLIENILAELSTMSEEDAQQLLADELGQNPPGE